VLLQPPTSYPLLTEFYDMDNMDLERRGTALRHELKAWEKTFALQNEGRKAARDDIKANASICMHTSMLHFSRAIANKLVAQKYKEYNKIRDILSGKAAPQTPSRQPSKHKPAFTEDADKTPKAQRRSLDVTPAKRKRDSGVEFLESEPPATGLLSPQGPSMIGPTPQRDGIVLGLFDLLPAETPSKRRAVLAEVQPNVLATPSKHDRKAESQASIESRAKWERTPQSSSKRFMLDQFVTPQKMKRGEQGTPRSSLKGFTTPTFLRRNTALDVVDEDHEPTPRPAPWIRKGLGRSLSSMIQTLKKQEEDRLDEEADIMRELEMEAQGIPVPKKQKVPDILVEDSQAQVTLDVDGFLPSEEEKDVEADNAQNENGQPRKVWKKRGQKRQTRRSFSKC
jgi:26S proteasome regulatory subunit N12